MHSAGERFNVGGVLLDRPFKIRRLGHFGFNLTRMDEGVDFYVNLLGFRVSDVIDYTGRAARSGQLDGLGDPRGYFTRYGTDHHALVLFNQRVREALGRGGKPGVTVNQITWQVGSLREVVDGAGWLARNGFAVDRSGRDMPGSNWHVYAYDPEGHLNELYYGIEQIGWSGHSKPRALYHRGFREAPALPQPGEQQEVQEALANGVDLFSGQRHVEALPPRYDVDGVLLPRPFKVVRIGPVTLFVSNLDAAEAFYRRTLGFTLTEETTFQGNRCLFLRCNTEHHSLALLPLDLRARLGLSAHSTCAALGLQLASYRQLRHAVMFLKEHGVEVLDIFPPELHPGIDYAHVLDPDGHCIRLYYAMEQIGWDGRPRPVRRREPLPFEKWPEVLENDPDAYVGEPFLGPWG
ncbi:MAG TPA: VOC family protein [candidate division Zixibacteria bacterium]|nr:VOC family protein [candidate division Zixibacteria bacterium]